MTFNRQEAQDALDLPAYHDVTATLRKALKEVDRLNEERERTIQIVRDAAEAELALMERCKVGTSDRIAHSLAALTAAEIGLRIKAHRA
jgi:hypothetical protein